jgi:hypothetical protein
VKLFVSGKKFKNQKEPPRITKYKAFLNASQDGELFKTCQLAQALNTAESQFRESNGRLEGFFYVHKNVKYFGKPRTIKALIKETSKP